MRYHGNGRSLRRWLAASLLVVGVAGDVRGQSATGMIGKAIGADDQVKNAAGAAEEALKTVATQGESTRGATGAIGQLITDSDILICSAWIMSFRTRYRQMIVEMQADGELDVQEAEALRAMQNLMTVVEKACDKVLNPEAYKNLVSAEAAALATAAGVPQIACPECEPLRLAYEQRSYEHGRAQNKLNSASRHTDFVKEAWRTSTNRAETLAATAGDTPEMAESREWQRREEVEDAWQKMDAAHALWLECVKRCHDAYRQQYGFLPGTGVGSLAGGLIGNLPAAGATAVGAMFGGAMMVSYDSTVMCTFGGARFPFPRLPPMVGRRRRRLRIPRPAHRRPRPSPADRRPRLRTKEGRQSPSRPSPPRRRRAKSRRVSLAGLRSCRRSRRTWTPGPAPSRRSRRPSRRRRCPGT